MAENTKEPTGRQISALARKDSLTPQERKGIAERAASARWSKPLVATHKGSFAAEFGIDVECYVINDATRTAVISQTGMGKAIGLSSRGNALPRFLASKAMSTALGAELHEKLKNPLIFQWGSLGAQDGAGPTIHGYDAAILIDLCNAILRADADKKLNRQQKEVARQAGIIVGATAKSGIRGLVYALAGYSPSADEVIQAFKVYVQEEAKKYEREFPPELYAAWQKLYQIAPISRGRPWEFMHLTVNHIYTPLARSNGKVLELLRALKSNGGDRRKKLFQFLNDIGSRALRMQIGRVLEMAEDSQDKSEYESRIRRRFGGQQEFNFAQPSPSGEAPTSQEN